MTEQHLDHPDIDVLLEQVGGEAVPQGVQGDALVVHHSDFDSLAVAG
jgi:hypothetical protein